MAHRPPRRSSVRPVDLGRVERRPVRRRRAGGLRRPPLYTAGAVLLVVVLLGGAVFAFKSRGGHTSSSVAASGPAQRAVVFVISGATPEEIADRRLATIHSLIRSGTSYSNAWIGQAEAVGTVSAASAGSGFFPRSDGLIAQEWADRKSGQAVTPLDPGQVMTGSIDQVVRGRGITSLAGQLKERRSSARVLSVGGVGCADASAIASPEADYVACPVRAGNRWAPSFVAGHEIQDAALRGRVWSVPVATGPGIGATVEGWHVGQEDRWIARYTAAALASLRPGLTYVTFPELAQIAEYAPSSTRALLEFRVLKGVDADIGLVLSELRRQKALSHTAVMVTSTEPITPITDKVALSSIDEAVIAGGGEKTYLEADKAAFIGLRDPLQAQPVAQAVQAEALSSVEAIYYRTHRGNAWEYTPEALSPDIPVTLSDAFRSLLATMATSTSADVVLAYRPGVAQEGGAIAPFLRSGGGGGLQWDSQHIPLILAGPGVARGHTSRYPARLVDLAPTLERVMDLPSVETDGIVLADALVSPPDDLVTTQRQTARSLDPIVRALQKRMAQVGPPPS